MGTSSTADDEWIELHNPSSSPISLTGWTLNALDGTPSIALSGSIPAFGWFLLERDDDGSVPGVPADLLYSGELNDLGEVLELRDNMGNLIDILDLWHAGQIPGFASQDRVSDALPGTDVRAWQTSIHSYGPGLGSPCASSSMATYDETWYDVYFSNHIPVVLPGAVGPSATAQALIDAIDASTTSLDLAVYGMTGGSEIRDAISDAVGRGVNVRAVIDTYDDGFYSWRDSELLVNTIPMGQTIADLDDRIMHNKFAVIDGTRVWTGSGNWADTGIYLEYNSNWSILIDHPELASTYTTEFNEMYGGSFHTTKTDNTTHHFPRLADGTVMECYFAPTDDAETHAIVRAINQATNTLDCRIFFFTDGDIAQAILDAHNRGVTVRILTDASSAENSFSQHQVMRDAGIQVKVEDWGGKEHHKSLIADQRLVIIGSQNWTGSGNFSSDENTLFIENTVLAVAAKADYDLAWASIDNAWLTADPGAESADSTGSLYDFIDNDHDGLTDEGAPEQLNTIEIGNGAINVYFNKSAMTGYADSVMANHNVDLEARMINRITNATTSIDVATYEINLPGVVQALIDAAASGIDVRLIADAKDDDDGESYLYDLFRIHLERLIRGNDGMVGTSDDVHAFGDAPLFATTDPGLRAEWGLPPIPSDFPFESLNIGSGSKTGYTLCYGELKANGTDFYSPGNQMHNKFAIIDGTWVWSGSFNYTINGVFGSTENRDQGLLGGNSNSAIELNSTDLALIYRTEFEEMWGSATTTPNGMVSNFHSRKSDNTAHSAMVGGRLVEVYFSPGDDALDKVNQTIINEAQFSTHFCMFTWSDQTIVDTLKLKWEGSVLDLMGTLTGFQVSGVFDSTFWNQWWSASIDMTGRTGSTSSGGNPNTRWANPAPVYRDNEDAFLHHKYAVIDGHTMSNPIVIVGSTNWSGNGNDVNDENLLIIHDAGIADQFMQEVYARIYQASGVLP